MRRNKNIILKKDAHQSRDLVWNSQRVDAAKQMIEEYGECPSGHPFSEGDPSWRGADIIYEYSDKELAEITKCARDVIYFANTYCKVMTDYGIQNIKLRPYQERVLESFQQNRFNVFLASRQIGKCVHHQTIVKYKKNDKIEKIPIYVLYYSLIKQLRKFTIYEKIKLFLYKLESFILYKKKYRLI